MGRTDSGPRPRDWAEISAGDRFRVPDVGIVGTGSYLPSRIVSNAETAAAAGVSEEWILRKTGIRQRHRAAANEATSDLFVFALSVAGQLLRAGTRDTFPPVIGADIYSRVLDAGDRRTAPLFGDAAGAVVLGRVPAGQGVIAPAC